MDKNICHESAHKHVNGEAVYVDDISVTDQILHGHVVSSPHANARIVSFDFSEAQTVPGVYVGYSPLQ